MGQISVSLPTDGETIDASDYNTPINTIVNEINGELDNSNIASDAAIAGTKFASSALFDREVNDTSGNEVLQFAATASAVNELTITNAATGNAPSIAATGGDTNIDMNLATKGDGLFQFNGVYKSPFELGRANYVSGGAINLSVPARKYLRIKAIVVATGGTLNIGIRFNGDSGNNYAERASSNGGADSATGSLAQIATKTAVDANPQQIICEVTNIATQEKPVCMVSHIFPAGAANAPLRKEGTFKWANNSDQITQVNLVDTGGTGDMSTVTEIIVEGWN